MLRADNEYKMWTMIIEEEQFETLFKEEREKILHLATVVHKLQEEAKDLLEG